MSTTDITLVVIAASLTAAPVFVVCVVMPDVPVVALVAFDFVVSLA